MSDKSLVEQFNDSVENFEAQDDNEWSDRAISSLCRKFSLLAKASDDQSQVKDMVDAMAAFMTKYIAKPFNDPDDYESIDSVTTDIEKMGNALVGAARPGLIPAGTSKELYRLAAELVNMAEESTDGDVDDAFQNQAQKIGEIADALHIFEASPKPAQKPAPAEATPAAGDAAPRPGTPGTLNL